MSNAGIPNPAGEKVATHSGDWLIQPGLDQPAEYVCFVADQYSGEGEKSRSTLVRLAEFDIPIDEAMQMQVSLQNVTERLYDKDEAVRTDAQLFLYDLQAELPEDSQPLFLKALGCAVSAESIAVKRQKIWVEPAIAEVETLDLLPQEKEFVQGVIERTIRSDIDVTESDSVLNRALLTSTDMRSMSKIMEKHDVEGILSKSAELINALSNRNGNPKTTVWRNCVAALTFYAPFLDFSGYNIMAAKLTGLANEFFLEDNRVVIEKAQTQYELTRKHHDFIKQTVRTAIRPTNMSPWSSAVLAFDSRRKSLGSIEAKLNTDAYQDVSQTVDAWAARILISEDIFDDTDKLDEFTVDLRVSIAQQFNQRLAALMQPGDDQHQFSLQADWHPLGDEKASPDYAKKPKENGYRSRHLTYLVTINGEQVPFEIQILSVEQHIDQTWGESNHGLYKLRGEGLQTLEDELGRLRLFEARAAYLQVGDLHSALNPRTWSELLKVLPDLHSPIHEVFSVNNYGDLVPDELKDLRYNRSVIGTKERVFIPPTHVGEEQFRSLLGLLDSSLAHNTQIERALNVIISAQGEQSRRDGSSVVENHLLPVALHAAVMASASGRRWEGDNQAKFMETIVVAALLHDYIEDCFETEEDKREGLAFVGTEFGSEVQVLVEALTSPGESTIEDEQQRRHAYMGQLANNPEALFIKLSDRMQNITTDLASLTSGQVTDPMERRKIIDYYLKTERNLSELFDSLPYDVYRSTKKVVWKIYDTIHNLSRDTAVVRYLDGDFSTLFMMLMDTE